MKKVCFFFTLILLTPLLVKSQAISDRYISDSFRDAFNLGSLKEILASSQFQLLLFITIGVVAAIWLFYLWGSFKMAYEDMEISILKKFANALKPPRISAPNMDLPHLQDFNAGRLGFSPNLVAVDHKKEKEESESAPLTRGETTQQRG